MDKRTQAVLASQLHAELVSHMGALSRLSFLVSGRGTDPMVLVETMEADLKREIRLIGSEPSAYSTEELRIRVRIAQSVVSAIRAEVQAAPR